jgi:GAF domain-containing protein
LPRQWARAARVYDEEVLFGGIRVSDVYSSTSASARASPDLFDVRARQAATSIGDVAVATRVVLEEDALLTVAVHHRNSTHLKNARRVLGERFGRGEALASRVWESERGLLLVDVDDTALASVLRPLRPTSNAYLKEVGIRSMMIVPVWLKSRVVGTLGLARDPDGPPYTEEDFERLSALARFDDA